MSIWTGIVDSWVAVLIQLGGLMFVCGLCWNGVLVILDTVAQGGDVLAPVLYRVIGMIAALAVMVGAPSLVNELQAALRTPLLP